MPERSNRVKMVQHRPMPARAYQRTLRVERVFDAQIYETTVDRDKPDPVERYIAIVYPLKYVQVMTSNKTKFIIAMSWVIPAILSVFRWLENLYSGNLSEEEVLAIYIVYTLLMEIAPIIILIAVTLHVLLIARKLSIQMSTLLTQVRFNLAANSVTMITPVKVGLKAATVRLVIALVAIFVVCYGTEIYITICQTFELRVVSKDERTAFSLLLMANSVLNPLVYAILKKDVKRETKALFCRGKSVRIRLPCRVQARQE
ncbi:hypothetical protein ACROYT_G010068 [Oculina patagonica]